MDRLVLALRDSKVRGVVSVLGFFLEGFRVRSGCFALRVCMACAALVVLGLGMLRAQTADPVLSDGVNDCNGSMAVEFTPPAPGTYLHMHLKVYMWGNATNEAYGKFTVYKFNPLTNKYEKAQSTDAGRKLQDWLNGVLPGSPSGVQHAVFPDWWLYGGSVASTVFGFNQPGSRYLIRNSGGVFHFGYTVNNVPAPLPSVYTWLTNQQGYDFSIEIRRDGVLLPQNGAGEYEVALCKGDDIALSAEVKLQGGGSVSDFFKYEWRGLWGIQSPQDSSHVRAEELVANPIRVEVKRLGMCGVVRTQVLNISTLDRPTPTIDFPVGPVCSRALGLPEQVQLTPRVAGRADRVEWYFQQDGAGEGHWTDMGLSENVVPPAPFSQVTYGVSYSSLQPQHTVSEGLPVTHRFRLVAKNGVCAGEVVRDIKVYPPIAQPVLQVDLDKPDGCSPLASKLTNRTRPPKSGPELWVVARPGAVLGAPSTLSHGVQQADILATNSLPSLHYTFESTAVGPEVYTVRYLIQDKTGSCLRHVDEQITVNPLIEAKFDLDVQSAAANGLPCSPVNVTARDRSVGGPVQWSWTYEHNGVSQPFGQFGGVPTGVANEPAFSVQDENPVEIELTVRNQQGCTSTRRLPLTVYPVPSATLVATQQSSDCLPVQYKVEATNIAHGNDYRWWVRSAAGTKPLGDPGMLSAGQVALDADFSFENDSRVIDDRRVVLELSSKMGCVTEVEVPIVVPPLLRAQVVVVGAQNAGCPDVNGVRVVRLRDESVYPFGPPPVGNPLAVREWLLDGNPIPHADIVQITADEWDLTLRNMSTTTNVENTLSLSYTIAQGTPRECKSLSELKLLTYPRIALDFDGVHHAKSTSPQPWVTGYPGAECALVDAKFTAAPHSGADGDLVWRIFTGTDTVHRAFGGETEISLDNRTAGQVSYTVRLRGRRGECSLHLDKEYVVNPRAEARMEFVTLDDCNPYKIRLTNATIADPGAPYVSQWFLDGGVETPPGSGEYVYTTPGEKRVKLVTTYGPCVSETPESVFTVLPPVVVNVGLVTPGKVCAPAQVEFANGSTGVTKMQWFFERLDPSSGIANNVSPVEIAGAGVTVNPVHVYQNKGSDPQDYHVLVRGENERGCPQEATVIVSIYPEPIEDNSYSVSHACTPFKLRFESKSSALSDYVWTFTPVGTAAAFGSHIVEAGVQSGPVELVLPNTAPNDSLSYRIEYEGWKQWPAGGPRCAVARKGLGMVRVPPLLNPVIIPKVSSICSGGSIVFEDRSTGGAVKQLWDFDDGTVDEGPKQVPMVHTFVNASTRDRIFTVRVESHQLSSGCTRSVEVPVRVHPEVKAIFAHGTPDGRACEYPLPVEFTNRSMVNVEASEVLNTEYVWEYGYSEGGVPVDMTTNNKDPHIHLFKISHSQNESETRTVKLTVTQTYAGETCSDNTTREVVVWQELKPSFTVDTDEGCLPVAVQLNLNGKPDIAGVQNVFDFGDGTTSEILPGTVRLVEHLYNDFSLTGKKVYTIRMTMSDKRKCTASFEQKVTVHPKLEARFTLDKQQYCSPDRVRVTNETLGGTQYAWSTDIPGLFLPDTYNREPFDVNVANPFPDRIKSYSIKLFATQSIDGFECTDTYEQKFDVYPEVKPDFEPSVLLGCNPLRVEIDNKSSGLGQYHWFIDGVDRSKEDQPVFVLSHDDKERPREFEIRLRSTNPLQCSAEKAVTVTVRPLVESLFNLDAVEGCTPMLVFGTAQSVSSAYSYQWDIPFGTPNTSTQVTTGRVEVINNSSPARPLVAKVKLRTYLTDDPACFAEQEKEVTVHPAVRANFDGVLEGCNPYLFTPQNMSEVYNAGGATWLWSTLQGLTLGDRDPELRLVNTSKEQDHQVQVSLRVTSDKGCTDEVIRQVTVHPTPEADFRVDGTSEACTPFDVLLLNTSAGKDLKYTYDFGDGSSFFTTERKSILHRYENLTPEEKSYQIKLVAESQFGCKDETARDVIVYPAAQALFDIEPSSEGCSPLEVKMINRSAGAVFHKWDFGDGTVLDMFQPDHVFWNKTSADVTYTVKLSVATARDCRDSVSREVKVLATPVAQFDMDPSLLLYPASSVTLSNRTDPQPTHWAYRWDFGDGHFSNLKDPGVHSYSTWAPKEHGFAYKVKLSVEADRCRDEVEQLLYLYAPAPEGSFASEQNEGCAPMRIFFENNVLYGTTYEWNFGDDSFSNEAEPIHTFERPGTYNVKLTVTGDGGVTSFYGIYVVHEPPVASFTVHPDKVMLPRAMVKTQPVITPHITKFFWDFGDGATSVLPAPIHQYETAGDYVVRLRVESGEGCSDTVSSSVLTVLPRGRILFPDAFRPSDLGSNGGIYERHDRKNEVFHPYTDGISRYTLYIYNRWGELVYQSNDVERGWDGYRNGVLCKAGVYGWRAVGTFYNGEIFDQRGNVTLLR